MVKIILSKYGDTLKNKDANLDDILIDCIGNHSCGTANIGKLNLSNYSPKFNVIVCSHCHRSFLVPKSIETFRDLEEYFEGKLKIKKIYLRLLKKNGKLDGRVLTIKLNKKGDKTFTLLRFKKILKEQMKINLSYIFEECQSKRKIFSLGSNGNSCFITGHYKNCLFVQATELVIQKRRTLYDEDMIEIAGMTFQIEF